MAREVGPSASGFDPGGEELWDSSARAIETAGRGVAAGRIRAAIEALPFESAKLSATAVLYQDVFASGLSEPWLEVRKRQRLLKRNRSNPEAFSKARERLTCLAGGATGERPYV